MSSSREMYFLLALQGVPGLGDLRARKLIEVCGSAEAVFREKPNALLGIEGVGVMAVQNIRQRSNLERADRELKWIEANNVKVVAFKDEGYPYRLNHCPDGPILLFYKGEPDLNARRMLSVVGTRKLTAEGRTFCKEFIEELRSFSPVIVSGYAYGTDICAHLAALDNGLQTIACMAHGLDQTYPYPHRIYNERILDNGGFITDFRSDEGPERDHFLRRNRIIAGISQAVVVIESAEKGGSLVTADIANSYNRDVFAVPGRPGDPFKKGCNGLIKRNQAHLVENASDLIYMLGWDEEKAVQAPVQGSLFPELEGDQGVVFAQLQDRGKMLLDEIAWSCNLSVQKTSSTLLEMEIKGVVRPLPGKYFELVS